MSESGNSLTSDYLCKPFYMQLDGKIFHIVFDDTK